MARYTERLLFYRHTESTKSTEIIIYANTDRTDLTDFNLSRRKGGIENRRHGEAKWQKDLVHVLSMAGINDD